MVKTKCLIQALVVLSLIMLCSSEARAAEAVKVYLEMTSTTATMWPTYQDGDYLRGRAIFLDANNELATTFDGKPIADAQLVLKSSIGATLFSSQPAKNLNLDDADWEAEASSISLGLKV